MIGTSNPMPTGSFPNDATGNRRFTAIDIRGGDAQHVRDHLGEHRTQLWAEASHAYHLGVRARLPDSLKAAQSDGNEQHRRRDAIIEDELAAWLGDQTCAFPLADAARALGLANGHAANVDQRTTARLSRALKACGYESHRELRNDSRQHVWQPTSG